jgi:hypothetical protein
MARASTAGGAARQAAGIVETAADPADPIEAVSVAHPVRKAVTAVGLVDVVGALAAGSLADSLYLFDNNRGEGSTGNGMLSLSTPLGAGDLLVWVCMALECEAFARIHDIRIDARYADYIALDCDVFTETAVVYWTINILKPLPEPVPYWLVFHLGSAPEPLVVPSASFLVPADPAASGQGAVPPVVTVTGAPPAADTPPPEAVPTGEAQ